MRNHLWYLTGQMTPLALCDSGLTSDEREELAREILKQPREEVKPGKPKFPVMVWSDTRPSLAYFVTPDSWLIFQLLDLSGEWLVVPCHLWSNFAEYRKLEEFCLGMPCTNDSAERGCHLITEFMNQVHSEDARQDLVQCVQYWRSMIKSDLSKESLKKI